MKYFDTETDGLTVKQINALFRKNDESHLWPVCGRFDATDRAIRRLSRLGLEYFDDYAAALDSEISQIVNDI